MSDWIVTQGISLKMVTIERGCVVVTNGGPTVRYPEQLTLSRVEFHAPI